MQELGEGGERGEVGEVPFRYHPPGKDFWMHLKCRVLGQELVCVGEKEWGSCTVIEFLQVRSAQLFALVYSYF